MHACLTVIERQTFWDDKLMVKVAEKSRILSKCGACKALETKSVVPACQTLTKASEGSGPTGKITTAVCYEPCYS